MILLLLAACERFGASLPGGDPAADRAAFVAGLASGDCAAIGDAALADECREATAKSDGDCEQIGDATLRGECWFQLAEATADASKCRRAGPFVADCALHVLSRELPKWLPKDARPGTHEAEAAARIEAAGLSVDDMRPWSAYYRHVLGSSRPIDRAACANVADAERREACERTGVAMYHDLLNMARDRGLYPCDGGPLPSLLAHTPDPALDAARASRTDLCPRR